MGHIDDLKKRTNKLIDEMEYDTDHSRSQSFFRGFLDYQGKITRGKDASYGEEKNSFSKLLELLIVRLKKMIGTLLEAYVKKGITSKGLWRNQLQNQMKVDMNFKKIMKIGLFLFLILCLTSCAPAGVTNMNMAFLEGLAWLYFNFFPNRIFGF